MPCTLKIDLSASMACADVVWARCRHSIHLEKKSTTMMYVFFSSSKRSVPTRSHAYSGNEDASRGSFLAHSFNLFADEGPPHTVHSPRSTLGDAQMTLM